MTTVEKPPIEAPPDGHESPARRWPRLALAAVWVIAVLAGYQSWLLYQHHRTDAAAGEALGTAAEFAETLTTASPATIDQQITGILDGSTGGFHERYATQSSELRALLLANQVTTTGSVVNSAVKSADAGSATVLLFVRQTFTSTTVKGAPAEPPADVTPMAITLQKVAGRWLVSDVIPGEQQK